MKATPETTNPQSPFSLGLMDRCITDSMVWLERAVHYARRLGLHKNMVIALSELSLLAYIAGDHDRAVQLLEERLSVTVANGALHVCLLQLRPGRFSKVRGTVHVPFVAIVTHCSADF